MSDFERLSIALDKKRISIDQNFLSYFADGKLKSQRLLDVIRKAHSSGKIICPIHMEESIHESAGLPSAFRDKVFAIQLELSDGFAFHNFAAHVCFKTRNLIFGELLYPRIWDSRKELIEDHDFATIAKEFEAMKQDYNTRVAQRDNYPPVSFKMGMKGVPVYHGVSGDRAKSLWRIVESIKTNGTPNTGHEELELAAIVGGFLAALQISPAQCERLIHCIRHHQWEAIEYLYVHARLGAQLELQCLSGHRDMNLNDQLDLSRLAVALNDADIVLCDVAMAENIKQSKILETLKTVRVYSTKEQDEAAEYIEHLGSIADVQES